MSDDSDAIKLVRLAAICWGHPVMSPARRWIYPWTCRQPAATISWNV